MILNLVDQRRLANEPLAAAPTLLAALVARLGRPHWELNLVLVDDEAMADLNVRYHGSAGATDVLSFSYLEAEGPAAEQLASGEAGAARTLYLPRETGPSPEDDPPLAGEVVVAPRFIGERCRRENWDLQLELAMLLVHGALHILGWDHEEAAPRRRMRELEAAELARQGLGHPLLPETESS
jgi:probable rRNA maturation factor